VKLHPEDLDVTSFDTGPEQDDAVIGTIKTNPNDPTPGTWCRICPVGTDACY
jgi:hypothetical protein